MSYETLILVGRLGSNVEIRATQSGEQLGVFSLATDFVSGGEKRAKWWRVTVWGDTMRNCEKHIGKGSLVAIEGDLSVDSKTGTPRVWQKSDGTWTASLEVNARKVQFLGNKYSRFEDDDEVGF